MRSICAVLAVLSLILSVLGVAGFAKFMTDDYCDRKLAVGVEIMGTPVEESTQRLVAVKRGDLEVENRSLVTSLDGLVVELSPKTTQTLLEVDSDVVVFKDGKCADGRRVFKTGALEAISGISGGKHEIRIRAGWSTSYAVKLTPTFILHYEPLLVNTEDTKMAETAEL